MKMRGSSFDCNCLTMRWILLVLSFVVNSSVSSQDTFELGPALLCQSQCLSKCFTQHGSSSTTQCQYCDTYNEEWIQQNCSTVVCQETCDGLVQNQSGSEPPSPKLQMSEGEGVLHLSWEQGDDYEVYILQQNKSASLPWELLEKTTSNIFDFTQFSTPPCQDAIKQISVISVNEYGASPASNVIQLDGITTATNFRYQSGKVSQNFPDNVILKFSWTNNPGWSAVVGRYSVSVVGYNKECGIDGHSGTGRTNNGLATEIDIPIAKKAIVNNCIYTFMLHNDAACYSVKNLTTDVHFDCSKFTPSLCVIESSKKNFIIRPIFAAPFQNQSAFISWNNPNGIPDDYEIQIRWGDGENFFGSMFSIADATAEYVTLPVTASSILLTNLEPITYGVQVAIIKPPQQPPFNIMYTKTFQIPLVTSFPTGLPTSLEPNGYPASSNIYHITNQQSGEQQLNKTNLIAIGGTGVLVIAALCTIFCVCYVKHNRKEENKMADVQDEESVHNIYSTSFPTGQSSLDTAVFDRWEIPYDHIQTGDILGEGAFGKVVNGKISGRLLTCHRSDSSIVSESMRSRDVEVAVKMLHEYAVDSQKQEFMREIKLMKNLGYHANVVSLIACCTHQDPICLVVEHCSKGDLLNFLRSRRPHYFRSGQSEPSKECLSSSELLSFARQIVLGMEYLSQKGFVHRDLAARNVLVMEDQTLKIGDFGLTRFVYDDKVYVHRRGGRLPIKWMSIESVFDQVFTSKSDVWSFGILMYEIITLGSAPYPGVSNHDIPRFLKRGYRMERPDGCAEELYAIMISCWMPYQDDRPTFTYLRQHLENILQQDTPYLEFDISSIDMGVIEEESSSHSDFSSSEGNVELNTTGNNNEEVKVILSNHEEEEHPCSNHGDIGDETKNDETWPMLKMSAV